MHAEEWHCDANNVAIMGFSAGGHKPKTGDERISPGLPKKMSHAGQWIRDCKKWLKL